MTEKYILIEGGVKDTANGITWDSFLELVIVLNGQSRQLQKLSVENEQLKQTIETQNFNYENAKGIIHSSEHQIQQLQDEIEQLKQRNDRQAKQLDRLYRLIEEKDWRTLTDILDDFKRCEEQLQRESGTYGDVE